MQDALKVEILQGRDYLFEVISHLWFQKGVSRFPNMSQRLQKKGGGLQTTLMLIAESKQASEETIILVYFMSFIIFNRLYFCSTVF